jgi:hypothetical protein
MAREVREAQRQAGRAAVEQSVEVWADSFRKAVTSGELKMSWMKLGLLHEDVPRFAKRFGTPLVAVTIIGHELKFLPEDFGDHGLRSLTSLNLASNLLERLPGRGLTPGPWRTCLRSARLRH